ncbi:YicC/YloC family endoribonuclease [Mongoliitalea daihaiensis]|uniref:YicC/YloC family endoribonuclease n=1 Tax=Mongoliitalea daihaiensis TaxID=2782006 RepID=UPI001F36A5ED|nr:YicC/YloC family endoribonuclease [Mongoliitalea daihaiensis]UJP63315.1 YicC family protein [Mongoliitalea daihaiensis]
MIKSMTGYGQAIYESDQLIITVEVKTLNSKFLDLSIRSPRQYSDKELEIRNLVGQVLDRGKVNLTIELTQKSAAELPVSFNQELFQSYILKYKELSDRSGVEVHDLFKLALQSPNVMTSVVEKSSSEEDWPIVKETIQQALTDCDKFRMDEGNALQEKFLSNLEIIRLQLSQVKVLDPMRKERVRSRIRTNFADWLEENSFDKNRFEQELIYYFEKIDITEEIVRLEMHLNYFEKNLLEALNQGKKLGFISQEIGREINTIGSKANDAEMQQSVVIMKDELEKVKEQALNIL